MKSTLNGSLFNRGYVGFFIILCCLFFMPRDAMPTAFNYGEGVSPLEWPVGTRSNPKVIKISIEADPDSPPDRSALLKEGMERWNAELENRGLKLEVTVRNAGEDPPAGSVNCHYGNAGDRLDLDQNDPSAPTLNGNAGLAGCSGAGGTITSAEILIKKGLAAVSGWDKDYIRNLGAHEVTHILGLADHDADGVTDHDQSGDEAKAFNDEDRKEMTTLYPVLADDNTKKEAKAKAQTTQGTTPQGNNQYNYTFTYDTDDGEFELGHVTLITLGIDPSVIEDIIVQAGSGWLAFNPADPARTDPAYPFYQGYMVNGHGIPAPWDPTKVPAVAFRFDPAGLSGAPLTYENGLEGYSVTFSIIAKNDVPDQIPAWYGGHARTLTGPIPKGLELIPSLSVWGTAAAMLVLALTGVFILQRRLRKTV